MEQKEKEILKRITETLEKLPQEGKEKFLIMAEGAAMMADAVACGEKKAGKEVLCQE
ncbi:MAG: hypothetical protein IJM23_09900 [Lachnospiraceae bacterium]|nr:hypothetical protein [Lachnospiraceae bacterium]